MEEEEQQQQNTKGSFDPGWNDPPMFSYDSHTTQLKSEKRGNILNKRVAFPLHSNCPSNKIKPVVDPTLPLEPFSLGSVPLPPRSCIATDSDLTSGVNKDKTVMSKNKTDNELVRDFVSGEALSIVMKNFNEVIENKSDNAALQEKAGDIRKRLDIIKKMWEEKKFTLEVQHQILQLSEAVKSGDAVKADHLQKCLMVDYASLCSPWMSGVRHILHSL